MRFSATALLALAATAVATDDYVTETVTEYATYCPASSSGIAQGSSSVPAVEPTQAPGYTTTRPLITSTITRCNKCSSSTPAPVYPASSSPVAPAVPSSSPVIPAVPVSSATPSSSAGPSGIPSGTPSGSPSAPLFTAGASRAAAGAGVGLASVFSLVAYLL
ncbi:hypothetical protein PHISCL_07922 [Aspergillus sclerotialis]|uniref:GPI anchored protein n=1 Tax=Aspergillus sclerotialis TaxID=2070753 RepID=A0A3A2Z9D8_9EURO|nr:hypothetical protein PHISCL_07922 [Aspergillus sclerotialis]